MSKQLIMCAKFKAKSEFRDELRDRLLEMVKLTNQEEGCLFYNLYVDRDDDNVFYFLEGWMSTDALATHEKTPHVRALIADAPRLTTDGIRIDFMHQISPI
jgi:quinol monooxygenase YgiN